MTIYMVRHGLAAAGVEDLDPGLDPLGHEQAAVTARTVAALGPVRLVVSPLRRTKETAAPLAALLGIGPEFHAEVAEVFDPSMPAEERRAMIGPFMSGRWGEQSPALRSWRDRVARFVAGLGVGPGHVAVVSHYIAIGAAVGAATGDDRVVPLQVANCSITSLDVRDGRLELREAASIAHLEERLVTGLRTAIPGV